MDDAARLIACGNEGCDHVDIAAARADALARIREVVASEAGDGPPNLRRVVRITDRTGVTVMTVRFAEAYS